MSGFTPIEVDQEPGGWHDTVRIFRAAKERCWIIRGRSNGWQVECASLCYWPGEIGVGDIVSLEFRNVTTAREFFRRNVLRDEACDECFGEERCRDSRYCPRCTDMMKRLRDLERRHKAMEDAANRKSAMWTRLAELQKQFKSSDVTDADKAAVLDQIMHEMAVDEEQTA